MQKPVKYISNKELLVEIGRSKASYSYFVAPEYSTFDAVVPSIDLLTIDFLTNTINTKASKMSTKANPVDPGSINPESIVFRVMTDAHLPPETDEKKRKKSSKGEWVTKPNFPPFKHYVFREGEVIEVGRSHWKNGIDNGSFCLTHGKISDRLARMFMMLAEQYSRRRNWGGYCVDESTEALTQRGWLGINDITEQDIILSYEDGKLKWSKIRSIYRGDYQGNMFGMNLVGMDALVTPGHKFVTDKGLKKVEFLSQKDRLILTGLPVEDGIVSYSDAFVELVGWVVTEGNYQFEEDRKYCRITVYQNEGVYADRIRACLDKQNIKYSECSRKNPLNQNVCVAFKLTKDIGKKILEVAENKVLSMPFILSLSQEQRELLINTMIDADGWRTEQKKTKEKKLSMRYSQKSKAHIDNFLALCVIAGYRASVKKNDIISFGKPTKCHIMNIFSDKLNFCTVENIDFHGAKIASRGHSIVQFPNEPTVPYVGRVWCPETEYGSFMVRRNGTVYLTGNSYRDEFVASALVHLSAVGLQFDESRSEVPNPFAFLTQIIKHVFTRVQNLEKRNQNIRDDLLIMAGAVPSFTKQIDDEFDQREGYDDRDSETVVKKPAVKRGRKPGSKKVKQA